MTAERLRNALMTLGMGVNDLARLTDVDRRVTARWFSGETPLPGAVEALLCVMMSERIAMDRVFDIVEAMTS